MKLQTLIGTVIIIGPIIGMVILLVNNFTGRKKLIIGGITIALQIVLLFGSANLNGTLKEKYEQEYENTVYQLQSEILSLNNLALSSQNLINCLLDSKRKECFPEFKAFNERLTSYKREYLQEQN